MARNLFLRDGVWHFRKVIDGKSYRYSTGFRDRRAAERRAVELEGELRRRLLGWTPRRMTFGQWAKWYERTYTPRKKNGRRDRQVLAHALRGWQDRQMADFTRGDGLEYINRRMEDGAQPSTIMREFGVLKAMFHAAVEEELIPRNPWQGVKRLRTEPRRRVLGLDEQTALLAVLNPGYYRLVIVALGTGLRAAELLGLRPRDIDGEDQVIHVRSETAKGGKRRVVPLRPEVADALVEQTRARRCQAADRLWPQSSSAVYKALGCAVRRAKLGEGLRLHDLRRTFATRCATAGMPLPQLQKIMGHASAEITMTYYVHVERRDLGRAMARIDLGLTSTSDTKVVTFEPRHA